MERSFLAFFDFSVERLSGPAHFAMCWQGVKAQEGAVLGGVGPARRGRAGQRGGGATGAGGGTGRAGLWGTAPRHRALPALCTEGESCAEPRRCLRAVWWGRAGARRAERDAGGVPGEPGRRDQCPRAGRGAGWSSPASRPCCSAPAAEEQVRGLLT